MKQELPISVILLALGAWCWFQFPSNQSDLAPRLADDNAVTRQTLAAGSLPLNGPSTSPQLRRESADVVRASFESQPDDAPPATVEQPERDTDRLRAFAPSEFLQVATANDSQATDAIGRFAKGIQELPAFATRTKISSQLFGVSMAATGKYFQSSGGGKSRMEIQYVSPVAKTVLQMSDGRFVYILKSDHQKQKLEFIDLFRLANQRGQARGRLLPTTWVMGGGIGKAIAHYTDSFDFQQVATSQHPQSPVGETKYRGIWKPRVLLDLIHAGNLDADRPTKVVWADVPRQLPHAIELTFQSAAGEAAMPKRISFFQFSTEKELSTAKEMVRIEFSPFEFKNGLPDELFTLESTDFEATDVTKVYQAQILKLSQSMDKVANQVQPPADLR